jgi:hypothetical protein
LLASGDSEAVGGHDAIYADFRAEDEARIVTE